MLIYVCIMAEGDDSSADRLNKKNSFGNESDNEENVKLDIGVNLSKKNSNCERRSSVENNFGASSKNTNSHMIKLTD